MRTGAIVLALLLTGCGGPEGAGDPAGGGANAAVPRPDLPEAGSTLTLSAAGTGGCSARWDGATVTREQLLDRAAAAIDRAVAAVGGVQNLSAEAIPVVRVEAPADLSFACADAMLAAVQRAGFPRLILAPAGGAEAELTPSRSPRSARRRRRVVVRIGAGGRMTWNNEAVELAGLPERARRMGGSTRGRRRQGEVEIRPTREATFGAVHAAVQAARMGNVQATCCRPRSSPAEPPCRRIRRRRRPRPRPRGRSPARTSRRPRPIAQRDGDQRGAEHRNKGQ